MNKKILSLIIAGAMLTSAATAMAADAEINLISSNTAEQTVENKIVVNQYVGTVKALDKNVLTVAVETDDGETEAAFALTEDTPVFDINGEELDEVKEGDKVIVLSSAALLTKDIKPISALVITDEESIGSVYYDTFSKTEMGFISSDGDLVLNIADELEKEYEGKTLLVFYDMMTLSIPPQTNPTKIVVLDAAADESAEDNTESAKTQAVNCYNGVVEAYEKNILTVKINDESIAFAVDENTPVYDLQSQEKSEIKAGDSIYVFSDASLLTKDIKPVKAVVTGANEDAGVFVKMDTFKDSEWGLVSSDNELVINVEDKAEFENKELLVFYNITTRSIPAQTNPLKAVVIDNKENDVSSVEISFCIGDAVLSINGTKVEVEAPYVAGEGVTLVPLRVISEAFGAEVIWNEAEKSVSIVSGGKDIVVQIDNKTAVVNGEDKNLEEAPQLTENGITMLPLRFISETLGANVGYDDATHAVSVTMNAIAR